LQQKASNEQGWLRGCRTASARQILSIFSALLWRATDIRRKSAESSSTIAVVDRSISDCIEYGVSSPSGETKARAPISIYQVAPPD
jgi:hypothetical protein